MSTTVATRGVESLTPAQHWDGLALFARNELAAGGPDPQLRYVHWMNRHESWSERVWRAGVFMSVYAVATAEVIWTHWPWERMLNEAHLLQPWLKEHWEGLSIRKERKVVGLDKTGVKLANALVSYGSWAASNLPPLLTDLSHDKIKAWDQVWASTWRIYSFGRYGQHKLLELLRRSAGLEIEMPDIIPKGGWSPRETLRLLWPDALLAQDAHDDDPAMLKFAAFLGHSTRQKLEADYQLPLTMYQLQTLLCEYRESFERQYPGRSNDSEFKHWMKIEPFWPHSQWVDGTAMLEARAALIHTHALAEYHEWRATREELGGLYGRLGIMWSDFLYDYDQSQFSKTGVTLVNQIEGSVNERLLWEEARKTLSAEI